MIDGISSMGMPPAVRINDIVPAEGAPSFEEVFARGAKSDKAEQTEVIRDQSRKLVAEAFIRPLLAQIREQNNAAAPFAPGDAEKRFGPLIDQAVADSMTRPDRFPMVKAVERSMLARLEMTANGGAS